MRCKRCGRENPNNVQRCMYCNTPFYGAYSNVNMPQKKQIRNSNNRRKINKKSDTPILVSIVALILVLTTLVGVYAYQNFAPRKGGFGSGSGGGGGFVSNYTPDFDNNDRDVILNRIKDLNNGVMPEITYGPDGIPSFINGRYSNVKIISYQTAKSSLLDIKGLTGMVDPQKEYEGLETYNLDSHKFYRLEQVVNSVPVYGKQVLIETDTAGNIECINLDYDAGLTEIDTSPTIDENAAKDKVKTELGEDVTIKSCELNIYTLNNENSLAWIVTTDNAVCENEIIVISALNGDILDRSLVGNEIIASATDMRGNTCNFEVRRNNGTYEMVDGKRGIFIYDCNNTKSGNLVTSDDNTWNNASAVTAMNDVSDVVDFYSNRLNTRAFKNGRLTTIRVFVNYKKGWFKYHNAFSSTSQEDISKTDIVYGTGKSYVKQFDVTAHELTHSVVAATVPGGLIYKNQSGAINESYADIIGNLIQNELNNQTEWDIAEGLEGGAMRSMSSPTSHRQPEKINGKYMARYCYSNHSHNDCDNGGVHTNSGILNKAAYLMHQKGLNNKTELANLFCRSLNYMTSTTDFLNCRAALLIAAKDMGMTQEKIKIINTSLREVGIYIENDDALNRDEDDTGWFSNGKLSGQVANAHTRNSIRGAEIKAYNQERNGIAHTDANGNFSVELKKGFYTLNVSASGYMSCEINNIEIKPNETTYLENTIMLEEVDGNPMSQAGGKVTDAVAGTPVEGAKIKFRNNWGNKSGDYIKNENGSIITLSTNSDGVYYTGSLEYGYYTLEIKKTGYATQFVNIIASNQTDVALNQNVVLVPETSGNDYRITLEWDANPRDEDAHIVGDVPGDFHVYYRNKSYKKDNELLANLDHDDTQGNGFETITLKVSDSGTYRYYVHHYAGSGTLATSNAKVKVYQGERLIKQYNVPVDQSGKYWHVFDIVNNEVVSVNQITNNSSR